MRAVRPATFATFGLLAASALLGPIQGACGDDPTRHPDEGGGAEGGAEVGPVLPSRPVVCDPAVLLPGDLRCTGLYTDIATKQISPDAREFTPGRSLWSDGAEKRRFILLPAGTQIDTTDMDEWVFPVGTKVWKEFTLDGKLVETRLFLKRAMPSDWVFTTYAWEPDGSTAVRLDSGRPNAVGTYEIPNNVQCSQCHSGHADRLLGFEAVSLGLPEARGLTLEVLKAEGKLTTPPATTTVVLPGTAVEQNALGYLHVNCGLACHSPHPNGTSNFTGLHLRLSAKQLLAGGTLPAATDAYTTTVGKPFVASIYLDDPKYTAHQRVLPHDPDKSLLLAVVLASDGGRMPPILRHRVDEPGAQLLREWILNLP